MIRAFLIHLLGGRTNAEVDTLETAHEANLLSFITSAKVAGKEFAARRYTDGLHDGASETRRQIGLDIEKRVETLAGTIAAERDGYRAQLDLSDRMLKIANRRLQGSGQMPVTSFFC